MSRVFEFSKGRLEVDDKRVTGTVTASTSMQQMPGELAIDTPIDKFGPISINDLPQFRIAAMSIGFTAGMFLPCIIWLVVFLVRVMSSSSFGDLGRASNMPSVWWPIVIGLILGGVVCFYAKKKVKVLMAQFSNGGQTVYIPRLKGDDESIIRALDAYVREMKSKA